ncbi:MAG: filamentous hemagglutinin N-terminal domain-containing protein [Gammaproteobacteria bacterium]
MRFKRDACQWLVERSVSLCLLFAAGPVIANPMGGQVVGGNASIRYGSNTVITQRSNSAIVNWSSFSIAPSESTRFNQPSSNSVILNRVTGNNMSEIMGSLSSNGQVFLVNPSGIVFGKTAQVDVAGLVVSTASISNSDFMKGNYHFTNAPISSQIINQGTITIRNAGLAALVAPNVQNRGVIQARLGRVALAAGTAFTIDLYGDNLISFDASSMASKNEVDNLGRIEAAGGSVTLTAAAADALVENVVNMSGYISATSVGKQAGKIILQGYGNTNVNVSGTLDVSAGLLGDAGTIRVISEGTTHVIGNLLATGGALSGNGGYIETSGPFLDVSSAYVNASAPHGKAGTWFLDPTDITVNDAAASTYSSILGAGTNLIINATNNIFFTNSLTPVGWSTNANFTAQAGHTIDFNTGAGIAINSTGNGNVTLYSDFSNSGVGTVTFTSGSPGNTVNVPSAQVNIYYNPSSYPVQDSFPNVNAGSLFTYMLVHTAADLENINSNPTGTYALGGNISTGLSSFTPISLFAGFFNGNGFTISNLTINLPGTDNVGLFSNAQSSQIYNFSLTNSTIIGHDNVGAIAGFTTGIMADPPMGAKISNVFVSATVTGNNNVGGLVGSLGLGGALTNVLYHGTVTGSDSVGGLVGSLSDISATINTSLSIATLVGSTNVGGVLGNNTAGLQRLYDVYSSTSSYPGPAVGTGDSTGATALPSLSLTTLPTNFNADGNYWQTNGNTNYISLVSCGSGCVIPISPSVGGLGNAARQYVTVEQMLNNNLPTPIPTLTYYSNDSLMYTVPLSTGGGIYVLTVTPETPSQTQNSIGSAIDALKSAYGCNTSI